MKSQIKYIIFVKLILSVIQTIQLLDAVFFNRQCVKNLALNQTDRKKSPKVLYGSYDVSL